MVKKLSDFVGVTTFLPRRPKISPLPSQALQVLSELSRARRDSATKIPYVRFASETTTLDRILIMECLASPIDWRWKWSSLHLQYKLL